MDVMTKMTEVARGVTCQQVFMHLMWLIEQSAHGQVVTLKMDRTHKKADAGVRRGSGEVCYQEKKTNSEEERVKEKVYTAVQRGNKAVKRMWLH